MADRSIEILGSAAEAYVAPVTDPVVALVGLASAQAIGAEVVAGPVILTGLATSQAIGSLNAAAQPLLTGLASNEALGNATVSASISLTGLATNEALGTAQLDLSITLNSLTSAQALGTLQLDLFVGPLTGLASTETLGTAQVNEHIALTGIGTNEALGTVEVTQPILLLGLPSSEAIGLSSIQSPVELTGLASTEALGTAQVNEHIALTGSATTEAIGTIAIAQEALLIGLPSSETIGLSLVQLPVDLVGLASTEALGAARVDLNVTLTGSATTEAIGPEIVTGPVLLDGLSSAELAGNVLVSMQVPLQGLTSNEATGTLICSRTVPIFGLSAPTQIGVILIGYDQVVPINSVTAIQATGYAKVAVDGGHIAGGKTKQQGPVTGGEHVTVVAPGLAMAAAEDTFTSLNLLRWAPTTTGSGHIAVISSVPRGTLQLSTGLGANASAYLRSLELTSRSDAQIDVTLTPRFTNGTAIATASLGLYATSATYFRVSIEISRETSFMRVYGVENGVERINALSPLVSVSSLKLRILRNKETIYVILNDSTKIQTVWTTTNAAIEFGVTNDALGHASIMATVTKYTRNPVILFDNQPMKDMTLKAQDRIDGLTPPHAKGNVPVHIITDVSEFDLNHTYEYVPIVDYRQIGVAGASRLIATTDVTVRN